MIAGHIELYLRNFAFYLAALVWCVPFVLLLPLGFMPFGFVWGCTVVYLKGILFLLKWLCGLDYEVRNAGRLPEGPVLFASAHQSTWENLFFQLILGNPAMIAKGELFRYPLVGMIVRGNRHIPAYREGDPTRVKASMLEARRQAEEGRSILIYPSGTRTGRRLDPPARRGVAALYEVLGKPCVPIAHNSGLFWPNHSWLRYPGTIVIEFGEPIPPGLDKKAFLDRLSDELAVPTARLLGAREGMARFDTAPHAVA